MAEIIVIFMLTTMFLAVKAVEYRGIATWGPLCSVAAWVAFGVTVLVMLLT